MTFADELLLQCHITERAANISQPDHNNKKTAPSQHYSYYPRIFAALIRIPNESLPPAPTSQNLVFPPPSPRHLIDVWRKKRLLPQHEVLREWRGVRPSFVLWRCREQKMQDGGEIRWIRNQARGTLET